MPEDTLPIVPSEVPEALARQLEEALNELVGAKTTDPEAYRAYLLQSVGLAWEAAASGQPEGIQEQCELLERARWILEEHYPHGMDSRAEAAVEILDAIRTLQVGIRVITRCKVDAQVLRPREAAALRVLERANGYLQRKEVHERLAPGERPSVSRIGQILSDFFHDGLLLRYQASAQGGLTSFYALTPAGRAILSRQPKPQPEPRIRIRGKESRSPVRLVVATARPWQQYHVAAGAR